MNDQEIFHEILDVQPPWKIMHISLDKDQRELNIHLGYEGIIKKSFFGFVRKAKNNGQTCPHCHADLPDIGEVGTVPVHHLQTAGYTTRLHIPPAGTVKSLQPMCPCNREWRQPGTDCSTSLFNSAEKLLKSIGNRKHVQSILGLSDKEMEQIIELTDFRQPSPSEGDQKASPAKVDTTGIPSFNHPNWLKLVTGELEFETRMVALSMLLRRVQSGYQKNPTTDEGIAGVKVLRQFFTRNEKLLKIESAVIRGESLDKQPSTTGDATLKTSQTSLPGVSSPVWQQVVQGSLTIHTTNFALQMLITRALMNVKNNPGASSIEMGVRTIRNFFVTNEKSLRNEIAQLNEAL